MALPENTSPGRTRLAHPLTLLGLGAAVILLVVGGAALAGYQAGLAQRSDQTRATQTVELKAQFDLGVADLAAGRYTVAAERFEYVLQLDSNYPQAAEKLAEARQALLATATPTPEPTFTPAPLSNDPATILALAQQYAQAANWDGVIEQIARLRVISPAYEIVTADDLLFTAFRNRGLARVQGDAMEAGIRDLDQAAQFGPLDPEASSYRTYARYYLAAQSYWGVDWGQTVTILRELHLIAPNFRDTAPKLYQATLNYAAQLATAGDYCAAAEHYAAAQTLAADQTIADAQATAAAICLLTPTPEPTLDLTANPAPTDETPTPSP